MLGKIKSYSKSKGYGFLNAIGPDKARAPGDLFFNVAETSFSGVEEGMLVAFDIGKDRIGRRCAVRIRLPGDAAVASPGSRAQEAAERAFRAK